MKEISLSLKIEEINLILTALGNLPFIQVHELFNKIQAQASEQLAPQEAGKNGTTAQVPN
ncbi:hypothetical protein [Parafilimonas sp.]|uniref:hypothetical protein n=1 Tax=Parafilimonas sp. TaxID=1969739 RepID=UPI0039E48A3B